LKRIYLFHLNNHRLSINQFKYIHHFNHFSRRTIFPYKYYFRNQQDDVSIQGVYGLILGSQEESLIIFVPHSYIFSFRFYFLDIYYFKKLQQRIKTLTSNSNLEKIDSIYLTIVFSNQHIPLFNRTVKKDQTFIFRIKNIYVSYHSSIILKKKIITNTTIGVSFEKLKIN